MNRERNDAYSPQRMTAKQVYSRKAQRRRKRKLKQLRFFLIVFMLIALVTLSLTVFFKIDTIKITGQVRYSFDEIIEKSTLEKGKNLFLYKTNNAEKILEEEFVYIEKAKIKKHLPGTLEIVITEAVEVCTIEFNNLYYVVSGDGKVLETITDEREDLYNVKGIDMSQYKIGDSIKGDNAESVKLLSLVTNTIKQTNLEDITLIDLSDIYNINLQYQNRVTIKCGTQVELEHKLKYAKTILTEKIKQSEEGTLDVSNSHTSENAVFSPKREENFPTSSDTSSEETAE